MACLQGMARHCSGGPRWQLLGQSREEGCLGVNSWGSGVRGLPHILPLLSAGSLALFRLCAHALGFSL